MTDTATNAPAPNEAPATPDAAPFGELSDYEHALGNVLRACADLDEGDTRRVLLAVSELYDLNLWHDAPSGDPLIRVSSAVKLVEAARGPK